MIVRYIYIDTCKGAIHLHDRSRELSCPFEPDSVKEEGAVYALKWKDPDYVGLDRKVR